MVYDTLIETCNPKEYWRAKRAIKNATDILNEKYNPRVFFW